MGKVERAGSSGDGIPRRRTSRSKGGEAGEVTDPEANEEALSDTSYACSEGCSLSMTSSQVPLSLSAETQQLDLGLGILREGLLQNFMHWQRSKPPPCPRPLEQLSLRAFPRDSKGLG